MNDKNSKLKIQKSKLLTLIFGVVGIGALGIYALSSRDGVPIPSLPITQPETSQDGGGLKASDNPYSIEYLRKQDYPGSDIVIEQTLTPGSNYNKYIASYKSDGLKIYALMTVPTGEKPQGGYPVIIFNHGYIQPNQYSTAASYASYVDYFARSGYIVFKSDYRGNGNSEGTPGGHFSPDYTIDVLNAISSIGKYKDANSQKIGMWGHSLGGAITLSSLVISRDIKAASIWAGTVGPASGGWSGFERQSSRPHASGTSGRGGFSGPGQDLTQQYGTPEQNPEFWRSIDPLNFLQDINVPVEIQHGLSDSEVNPQVSQNLNDKLKALGKIVDYYTYPGDNHNLSNNLDTAMERSVAFFDKYVKGGER